MSNFSAYFQLSNKILVHKYSSVSQLMHGVSVTHNTS